MKVQNTTVFMGDATKKQRQEGIAETDNKSKSTIFAGGLNQVLDPIAQKRREAREQAMKIVGKAWAGEQKIDDDLQARRNKIKEMQSQMSAANDEIKKIEEDRLALRDSYGLKEDSQEEQDLKLLEKERDAFKPGSGITFTEEETKRLAQLHQQGMTGYQQRSLEMKAGEALYKKEIEEAEKIIREENAVIRGIKLERLKTHPMADANKEAEEVLAAASDEIVGMLVEEAKEAIDEKMEEQKEAAEAKAEEEKEEEEKLEKVEERKEQQEELSEEISEMTKQAVGLEEVQTDVLKEVQNILDKMKLIEEDIKGAAVDKTT